MGSTPISSTGDIFLAVASFEGNEHPYDAECRLPLVRPDFVADERAGFELRVISGVLSVVLGCSIALPAAVLQWPAEFALVPVLVIVLGGFWLMMKSLRKLYRDWVRKRDLIGEVVIRSQSFEVISLGSSRTIPFDAEKELDLNTNHIQGKFLGGKDVPHNGIGTLTIIEGSGRSTFKFLVRSEEERSSLLGVLTSWYRQGYPVRETLFGIKVFRMEALTYAALQDAKRKFGAWT